MVEPQTLFIKFDPVVFFLIPPFSQAPSRVLQETSSPRVTRFLPATRQLMEVTKNNVETVIQQSIEDSSRRYG